MITSLRNPRIVEARKLSQRKHRQRQGRFLVQGGQALHMALDAGLEADEVYYCADLLAGPQAPIILERFVHTAAQLVPVSAPVLEALSQRDISQGIVAAFPLLNPDLDTLSIGPSDLVVILDRPQNPGNLGTLIRTADAVGAAALIALEPCVDPFDPLAVRASMGSLFNIPLSRTNQADELLALLRQRGLRTLAAVPRSGNLWHCADWSGGLALILGNEAEGLAADMLQKIDELVHLPMSGRAESLNVAVVGGVLMYAWAQANPPPKAH